MNWIFLLFLAIAGIAALRLGKQLAAEKNQNKRDRFGVRYSERALFIMLNGIALLLAAFTGIALKLLS